MSNYTVRWTSQGSDPSNLPRKEDILVPFGTTDDDSTSLKLTGRNEVVYGENQQQNFIRLLENFANATAPANATIGQLWYDSVNEVLKVLKKPDITGYHDVILTGSITGASATGLANDSTVYYAVVSVEGATPSESIQVIFPGSTAQTYTDLLSKINEDLGANATATLVADGGNTRLRITSNTFPGSAVEIQDPDPEVLALPFFEELTAWSALGTPVVGQDEWVLAVDMGAVPLSAPGGTLTGPLFLDADPTLPLHAATKQYVDAVAQGINVRDHVVVATTGALTATYVDGTADADGGLGIGATLTADADGAISIDDISLAVGDRVLVKDQANDVHNGVYVVTIVGDGSSPFVLTRADDYNNSISGQVTPGDFFFVSLGTVNAATSWVMNEVGSLPNSVIEIGTDDINFSAFAGAGSYVGGSGISVVGPTISNTGVLTIVAGDNINISGATGNVTIDVDPTGLTAENASNIVLAAGVDNAAHYVPFSATAAGNSELLSSADLQFNPDSGTLAVPVVSAETVTASTSFIGNLTGTASTATLAVNISGGSAGQLLYQSASNTTSKLAVGTDGQVLTLASGVPTWATPGAGGTVTSVALSAPSIFSVAGSPVTTAGTLTLNLANQTQNTFFAAPNGSGGAPAFRAIVAADLPATINANTTGSAAFATTAGSATTATTATNASNATNATNAGTASSANFSTTQAAGTRDTSIATTQFVDQSYRAAYGQVGSYSSSTVFRADTGTGLTATFIMDVTLPGGGVYGTGSVTSFITISLQAVASGGNGNSQFISVRLQRASGGGSFSTIWEGLSDAGATGKAFAQIKGSVTYVDHNPPVHPNPANAFTYRLYIVTQNPNGGSTSYNHNVVTMTVTQKKN